MKKILSLIFIFLFSFSLFFNCNAAALSRLSARNLSSSKRVVILMYHRVTENKDEITTYAITPKELEKDIKCLKSNNYVFAFSNEIEKTIRENPDKNVAVLTFDDGYDSDYVYVLPLLEKYSAKATFFVFSSMLDKPYYLTKTQLKKLSDSKCALIGNHSYDIHNKSYEEIKKLYSNNANSKIILEDFKKNKENLENVIEKEVTVLSYPNGVYNNFVDNLLKKNKICNFSFSTYERSYQSSKSSVIGRYNRSDKRNAEEIIKNLK